jgi:hypothetical protein
MLEAREGELRASSRTIWAAFRPDLSYHPEKFARANESASATPAVGADLVILGQHWKHQPIWSRTHLPAAHLMPGAPSRTTSFAAHIPCDRCVGTLFANRQVLLDVFTTPR